MSDDKPKAFGDARVEELTLLARLTRGPVDVPGIPRHTPDRAMYVALIEHEYVNSLDTNTWSFMSEASFHTGNPQSVYRNALHMRSEKNRWESLNRLLGGQPVQLTIGHRGRVRLSELEQQLKTGRERDKFGVLIDGRHAERGVTIALTKARADFPVTVVFADMNGLKVINDAHDHKVGDAAITMYLKAMDTLTGPGVEGFSRSGDEVILVFEGTALDAANKMLTGALTKLGDDALETDGKRIPLSASCGIVSTNDPTTDAAALITKADKLMYLAKAEAKRDKSKVRSAIKPEGEDVLLV